MKGHLGDLMSNASSPRSPSTPDLPSSPLLFSQSPNHISQPSCSFSPLTTPQVQRSFSFDEPSTSTSQSAAWQEQTLSWYESFVPQIPHTYDSALKNGTMDAPARREFITMLVNHFPEVGFCHILINYGCKMCLIRFNKKRS